MKMNTITATELLLAKDRGELRESFEKAGTRIESEEDLETKAKEAWTFYKTQKSDSNDPIIGHIEPLRVETEHGTYNLFGICHDKRISEEYKTVIENAVNQNQEGHWLFEEDFNILYDVNPEVTGMIDKQLERNLVLALTSTMGYLGGVLMPVTLLKKGVKRIMRGSDQKEPIKLRKYFKRQYQLNFVGHKVPPALDIDQKGFVMKRFMTRRSAYQAEFARYFRPGETKNLLVGAAHVPEIAYFLQNGVKDEKITNRVKQDIELLQNNPQEYKSKQRKQQLNEVYTMFGGLVAGVGTLAGAIVYLY